MKKTKVIMFPVDKYEAECQSQDHAKDIYLFGSCQTCYSIEFSVDSHDCKLREKGYCACTEIPACELGNAPHVPDGGNDFSGDEGGEFYFRCVNCGKRLKENKNMFKEKIIEKEEPIFLWKSMRKGLKSENGKVNWKKGKWFKEDDILICKYGFHASEKPIHAMEYVNCEILAHVEVRGKSIKQEDKQCWSEMRIVETYEWTKEDSVNLAIFTAELVIDIYEKEYPNDDRPRKAIEAAKEWIKNPSAAAYAASATSATSAAYAAYAASATSATSAAYAAYAASAAYATSAASAASAAYAASAASAASVAAYAASAAASATSATSAASAAYAASAASAAYAASAEIKDKCNEFILKIIALKK